MSPAVQDKKRGGVKDSPRVIPVCVSRIRLRLDFESGHEMGHVGSPVGSGSGYRRRAWGIEGGFQVERIERGCQEGRKRFGGRDRDEEGESGRIHDSILVARILIDDIPGRHGVVVRVRLGEVTHAALQVAGGWWIERVRAEGSLVVIGQVLDANLCSSTFLFGNEYGFRRGRGARLELTGSLGLPLLHRFPVPNFLSTEFFLPLHVNGFGHGNAVHVKEPQFDNVVVDV